MTEKIKLLVTKSALRVLRLVDLRVDPSYQREVKAKHKRIVADFNPDALGIPLVGERSDGTLWVVDGLQRKTALEKLGKKEVRAEVFASQGPEHEAEVFKLVNLNRTKLTWGEQFKALLASHDESAWRIKEVVEGSGYRIAFSRHGRTTSSDDKSSKELTCISTLVSVNARWGTEPIRFALAVITDVWPGDRLGTYAQMIEGLAVFYNRHNGAVDTPRLVDRLRTVTAQKILYAANQATIFTTRGEAVAEQLEKVYRKRLNPQRGS